MTTILRLARNEALEAQKPTTRLTTPSCLWQQGFRGAWQRLSMMLMLVMLTTMTAWATDKTLSGSESYEAQNGDVLTGSTSGTVTIADNAKITLSDVTITGGIVCAGTAEITLVGTNSVTGFSGYDPNIDAVRYTAGIQVGGSGTTLTIKGNGSLTANGGTHSAGIGLSRAWCVDATGGDIVIEGGNITATGDGKGAGIGTGACWDGDSDKTATLGNITIKGGTVRAIGGTDNGNGIGKGHAYSYGHAVVGTITIYDGIDLVDASSISESVTYMHDDTDVTASKIDYFTITEDGNRRVITPKDNTDYTITIADDIEHGTLTGAATAKYMEKVTITATPALGYRFSRLVVKDAQNNDVASTDNSFFMPKSNVTVSAVFEQGVHGTTEFEWFYQTGPNAEDIVLETIYDGVTTVSIQTGRLYYIWKNDEYSYLGFLLDNDTDEANIPYAGGIGTFYNSENATDFRLDGEATAGYYDITLTDVGNGKWGVSILPTAAQMDVVPDQTYTGSEITPEPLVIAGSLSLTKGMDYDYSYENNENVGTAKVIATFQGTYAWLGYVEKEFKIVYPTVTTSYVDASGTLHENVKAIPLDNTMTELNAGWYVVNSNITVDSRINLTGNTNLILGDNCTLDVEGIYIPQNSTLTIYAQSDGATAGKIVSHPSDGAAIGGISGNDNGNIVICGGIIEATGGENCAAIGGGNGGSGGTITIYGGNITANDPTDSDTCENGAGIGGGDGGSGGIITINGGTITTYSRDGAGIGGGDDGNGGTITINGGTITSVKVSQGQGARIGGGCDGAPGTITINGGTITTVGGTGAGIGGGKGNLANGTVTINGGIINASGDYGIGAGEEGADVAITLGWTKATDQIYASSYSGTVTIAGGKTLYNGTEGLSGTINSDDFASKLNGKTLRTYDYRTVSYVKADGTTGSADAIPLTGSTSTVTLGSDGETTWYVVNSDVDYKRIELVGDVNLILCDGKKMTANGGSASAIIGDYRYSNSLTIYGQSAGTGKLVAQCGEGNGISSNAITINGGTVNAVGGQYFDISAGGNVIINGGNVSANGSPGGIMAGGDIILGWTNNTDRITASSFSAGGTISIADGKVFTDGSGNYFYGTIADVSTLADKTLTPVTNAIPYIDANGQTAYCTNYTEINTSNMPTTLSGGWYVVNGTVNYDKPISLEGDNVHLILADGAVMNIGTEQNPVSDDGIYGYECSISIYAQSTGNSKGQLYVNSSDSDTGSGICIYNGNVTICGGQVTTTGYCGIYTDFGDVTISGGQVTANGIGDNGSGIWANSNSNEGSNGGNVIISGGQVTATGEDCGIDFFNGIILGWMKATDQIYASSYNGTVTIVGGQAFINDASTPEIVSGTDIVKALVDGKTLKPHWTGSGDSESDPYMINRPGELDLLATNVNAGTDYSGKYFKLGADIAYSHTTDWDDATSTENNYTAIGGFFNRNGYPFRGTFDGQGHTVSGIRIYRDGNDDVDGNLGLFGFVQSGTVKNVTVSDMRITGYTLVGGIVGWNEQYSRVENCHATATVALNAVQDEADSFGGIVGDNPNNSAIIGCSSAVTITTSGTLTDCKDFGGIVGSTDDGCSVKNCLAVGVAIPNISFTHNQNDITASGAIAGCFSGDALSHNYYSGCTLGGTLKESGIGVGRDYNGNSNSNERHDVTDNNGAVPTTLHTLTLGEDITASGVLINQSGTISVASGSTVVLSYSGSLGANQIAVFSLGGTPLDGNTFTMPAADAQVSVSTATVWGIDGGADGSEGNPYVITRCAELDLLSQRVNSGTGDNYAASGYSSKTFVLANDIAYAPNGIDANSENYTAIGISSHSFKGIFDGQGHTISGIRIYKGGQTPNVDANLGLFGYVNNGTVRNVTLADASITGYDNIGGIAGNSSYGTIENCLVIGTSIRATHNINGSGGAIVGNNSSGTTLSHNYYSDCIRNISSSGIGTKNGDYSINDGAVRAIILSETEAVPSMNENDKVVFRRKFTQGVASTVCLPFSMTSIAGGTVYGFVGVTYNNTDGWVATMQEADPTAEPPVTGNEATTLAANTPYLFMPAATGPVLFYGTAPASVSAGTTTSGDWTFYGTYSRLTYETTESNSNPFSGKVFGFAAYATEAGANNNASQEAVEAGEFVKAISGAYIPAFRAFLKYAGSEESLQARGTRSRKTVVPEYITVRLIGKDGGVDAIGEISLSTGEVTFDSNAWYDLSGRKLNGVPTQKGIYIHKGKKVALH